MGRYDICLALVKSRISPQRTPTGTEKKKTRKALKPAAVEAVFMPSEGRQTICISTQAGCAVDCRFCLTAQLGLIRNLTAGEIVGQVLVPLQEMGEAPETNSGVIAKRRNRRRGRRAWRRERMWC